MISSLGLRGGVHVVCIFWSHQYLDEEWGFMVVDTCNVFNNQNRTYMLLYVWQICPFGARFNFNCYFDPIQSFVRAPDSMDKTIPIQEGAT